MFVHYSDCTLVNDTTMPFDTRVSSVGATARHDSQVIYCRHYLSICSEWDKNPVPVLPLPVSLRPFI